MIKPKFLFILLFSDNRPVAITLLLFNHMDHLLAFNWGYLYFFYKADINIFINILLQREIIDIALIIFIIIKYALQNIFNIVVNLGS